MDKADALVVRVKELGETTKADAVLAQRAMASVPAATFMVVNVVGDKSNNNKVRDCCEAKSEGQDGIKWPSRHKEQLDISCSQVR